MSVETDLIPMFRLHCEDNYVLRFYKDEVPKLDWDQVEAWHQAGKVPAGGTITVKFDSIGYDPEKKETVLAVTDKTGWKAPGVEEGGMVIDFMNLIHP